MSTKMTPEVEAVGQMHFEGNIIPHRWYQTIAYTTPGGQTKPHLEAILVLSDLVYWYRPAEVRDESTGKLVGHRKKFHGDLLQRSYQDLADQFGLSKRQVKRAIDFLKEKGLIDVEFRTIATKAARVLSNVTYIRLIPERLAEVTFGLSTPHIRSGDTPLTKFGNTLPPNLVIPPTKFGETYTETPEEISIDSNRVAPLFFSEPVPASASLVPTASPDRVPPETWSQLAGLFPPASLSYVRQLVATSPQDLTERALRHLAQAPPENPARRFLAILQGKYELPADPEPEQTVREGSKAPRYFTIPSPEEL
jgi:hypothetical protein